MSTVNVPQPQVPPTPESQKVSYRPLVIALLVLVGLIVAAFAVSTTMNTSVQSPNPKDTNQNIPDTHFNSDSGMGEFTFGEYLQAMYSSNFEKEPQADLIGGTTLSLHFNLFHLRDKSTEISTSLSGLLKDLKFDNDVVDQIWETQSGSTDRDLHPANVWDTATAPHYTVSWNFVTQAQTLDDGLYVNISVK